jgi:hypothetical protein
MMTAEVVLEEAAESGDEAREGSDGVLCLRG